MANFKYKMIGASHVLTQAEHEFCQSEFKKGKTVIAVRGGKIGINMSSVSWNTTDEFTEEQIEERERIIKLPEQSEKTYQEKRATGQSYLAATHKEFYKKMAWK